MVRMKTMAIMAITLMFALSLLSIQTLYAEGAKIDPAKPIKASRDGLNFTISAANITVKFAGSAQVPKFQYWYNTTDPNKPIYQVFFHQLFEFNDTNGDGVYNATTDKIEKVFALPSANLSLTDSKQIIEGGKVIGVQFNFTVLGRTSGPSKGANVTIQCSLYNMTRTVVSGTIYNVTGNAELKIDVIFNNWLWEDSDNRLCLWWSVSEQNQTITPSIVGNTVRFGGQRGYFKWISKATTYDATGQPATVDVNCSFTMPGKTANIYMCYPNFKGKTLIHDPSLGVDITSPTVSIASPSGGSEVKSSSTKITWSGSDVESGIDHYEIKLDKGSWVDAGISTTYTLTNVDDGSHTVSVKAVDSAGTSKEAQVSFIVNTSLIGGPGWIDDIAVFSLTTIGIALAAFLLIKRRRPLLH